MHLVAHLHQKEQDDGLFRYIFHGNKKKENLIQYLTSSNNPSIE